jgi:hypothetical protein
LVFEITDDLIEARLKHLLGSKRLLCDDLGALIAHVCEISVVRFDGRGDFTSLEPRRNALLDWWELG